MFPHYNQNSATQKLLNTHVKLKIIIAKTARSLN